MILYVKYWLKKLIQFIRKRFSKSKNRFLFSSVVTYSVTKVFYFYVKQKVLKKRP